MLLLNCRNVAACQKVKNMDKTELFQIQKVNVEHENKGTFSTNTKH